MAVAEPVAHAMSALHQIEATHGGAAAQAGAAALAATRQALATLQASAGQHPAVDHALEAIAGSLGLIHQLSQSAHVAPPPAAPPPAVSPYAGTMVAGNPGQGYPPQPPQPHFGTATQPSAAGFQPRPEAPPQVAYAQPPVQQPPAQQPPPAWQQQAAPPPAYQQQQPPVPAHQAPPAQAYQQPPQAPAAQAPAAQAPATARAAGPAVPPQAVAPPGTVRLEAELGAHSGTNFYKGLSGNDVIDSGGIFIATYNIPDVGQPLTVKVCLPGGYEFEAAAVVRWTRDSPNSGADSSPGFGAQFTQISAEGRQLVYRYVRNREPLFYDDL